MAAALVTDENVEQLDEMLLRLEEGREQSGSDLGSANEEFHQMIVDISGNRFERVIAKRVLVDLGLDLGSVAWHVLRREV